MKIGRERKMLSTFLEDTKSKAPPGEGELYKTITAHGVTFEIYYGYYEEADRQSPFARPMEIYPDFLLSPVYTPEGIPFVTAMQRPCEGFAGEADEDNTCYQCAHYRPLEELLGLCACHANRKQTKQSAATAANGGNL